MKTPFCGKGDCVYPEQNTESSAPVVVPTKVKPKIDTKSNPNKANQHKPDPRQTLFLANYINPKSETFGNCLQSAISAGYTEEYGKTIMSQMPTWLSESIKDNVMIAKAERNLVEFLDMDTMNTKVSKSGETYTFDDPQLKKIKQDTTKFVSERLNKQKYSTRQEVTGKDGEAVEIKYTNLDDKQLEEAIAAKAVEAGLPISLG